MRPRSHPLRCSAIVLLAWASLACAPPASSPDATADAPASTEAAGDAEVVATIDGTEITTVELDDFIKDQLLDQATRGDDAKLHELRMESLENLINEKVVSAAAEKAGLDLDGFIQTEAEKQINVTDEEIQAFFAENEAQLGGQTLEQLSDRIRQHLERQAGADAARKVVADVRAQHEIDVKLVQPRFEVAAIGAARGPEDAPITIVEFSDYQCPFCSRAEPIIAELLAKYPDQIRFVYRHFPLDSIHPEARAASEAAACAGDQDKFWEFHEQVFANQRALGTEDLKKYASAVGLDMTAFDSCVSERTHRAAVENDVEDGRAVGVTGTPAFFVNGIPLKGAQPVEAFSKIIDEELAAAG